jgi:hypothetical protein
LRLPYRSRGLLLPMPSSSSDFGTSMPFKSQEESIPSFKLTRSVGLSRMEALRATMRRLRRPSQLNAMFDGLPGHGSGAQRLHYGPQPSPGLSLRCLCVAGQA